MRNNAIGTKEYWNNRVKKAPNKKDMLFLDDRREHYWRRVREQLEGWADMSVLDVCCGFGQFSDIFTKYHGIDFSEEMIKLAGEGSYEVADAKTYEPKQVYDVIYEVNSLHSLNMSANEFYDKYRKYARVAIACLEADVFTIYQIYDR